VSNLKQEYIRDLSIFLAQLKKTIDALMKLEIPAGVDVEVKV